MVVDTLLAGGSPIILRRARAFSIQEKLDEHGSGLSMTRFQLCREAEIYSGCTPGMTHSPAVWIGRCAFLHNVDPGFILLRLQGEQGLLKDKKVLDPGYTCRLLRPGEGAQEGERMTVGRGGPVAWRGDWRMVAACGYGIAEGPLFSVQCYLGFDRQVWYCARSIRRTLDRWDSGDEKARTVRVEGKSWVCSEPWQLLALTYTPHLVELDRMPRIWMDLHLG